MLLAVDVGNSHTVLGLFQDGVPLQHWRLTTRTARTEDELALVLGGLLSFARLDLRRDVTAMAVASVVPSMTAQLRNLGETLFDFTPVFVDGDVATGLSFDAVNRSEVGADRVANAVAARELYGDAIVVDFGTATNFDVVTADGAFLGGVIAPGVVTSMDALVDKAARLPRIELRVPETTIGTSTTTAMQAGVMVGTAGMVDGIVERVMREFIANRPDAKPTVVATGGLSDVFADACTSIEKVDTWLTLKGLQSLWSLQQ